MLVPRIAAAGPPVAGYVVMAGAARPIPQAVVEQARYLARADGSLSTKDAETGHLFIFLAVTGITAWALASGWWDAAGWLLLFNLLHNGYPVLSMRQLRARLNAASGRLPRTR
jgi:hypothetical protein